MTQAGPCELEPIVASTVTPRLWAAALVGLLALGPTVACSTDKGQEETTSGTRVEGLDAVGFQALCDGRGGTVEVMAHCNGLASARGFSYDTSTEILLEHSCRGENTCAGWNCVLEK
jgi:hypothetical protein